MQNTIWKSGIYGVVIGDALGCPVQFLSREEVAKNPVTGMRGHGTFNMPQGSWTDDSSLTLAAAESVFRTGKVDPQDIMQNFNKWLSGGAFTPFGEAYDIGFGTMRAIRRFQQGTKPLRCGGTTERDNGNGSLMRILPACLHAVENGFSDAEMIQTVHDVGSLTHGHIRSNIACGLYAFAVRAILSGTGSLSDRLQNAMDSGFAFYEGFLADTENLDFYHRLRGLSTFAVLPASWIRSTGYVVDTLEAAIWSLLQTDTLRDALLCAVNLGEDTDSVAAVTGGLAGLFYGFDAIPWEWIDALQSREIIDGILAMHSA